MFGGRVDVDFGHEDVAVASHTVHVDDVPGYVVGHHYLDGFPRSDEQADDVDVEHVCPLARVTVDQGVVVGEAGVVDQNVDGSHVLGGPFEGFRDLFFVGHVAFYGVELSLTFAEGLGQFVDLFLPSCQTNNLK